MNKTLIISGIFVALLVASIGFAMMPVQKASTVHTTITAAVTAQTESAAILNAAADTTNNVAAIDGKKFTATILIEVTDTAGADVANTDVNIQVNDGNGFVTVETVTNADAAAAPTVSVVRVTGTDLGSAAGQEALNFDIVTGADGGTFDVQILYEVDT